MIRLASTGQMMVCIAFGEDNNERINSLLNAVKERFPEITSLLYVINKKLNDSIADQEAITFAGRNISRKRWKGCVSE